MSNESKCTDSITVLENFRIYHKISNILIDAFFCHFLFKDFLFLPLSFINSLFILFPLLQSSVPEHFPKMQFYRSIMLTASIIPMYLMFYRYSYITKYKHIIRAFTLEFLNLHNPCYYEVTMRKCTTNYNYEIMNEDFITHPQL